MALRSCLFGALLILTVLSTQSFAARRLDDSASAPIDTGEPGKNVYPKPPDPVPATVLDDDEPKKAEHTASHGTNQLPKTKRRKTEVEGKAAAVKPKDCNDDCGGDGGDDLGGGDGGDAIPPDCGHFWNGDTSGTVGTVEMTIGEEVMVEAAIGEERAVQAV